MSTALTIITPKDLQSADQVLTINVSYVEKYKKKYDVLMAKAKAEGVKLTPETDAAINDYLASAKKAVGVMEADRKPWTKKAQDFVALFTTEENRLKTELFNGLQAARDASVKAYSIEDAENKRKEAAKLAIDKAKVELIALAEQQIRNGYAEKLRADKAELLEHYEGITLELIDGLAEILANIDGDFKQEYWDGINASVSHSLIEPADCQEISVKAKEGKYDKVKPHYESEIKAYAEHLLSLIPERKAELESGKVTSEAAEKLKEEQALLTQQQTEQSDKLTAAAIQTQVASVIVDQQIDHARRSINIPKAQTIESYNIIVLDRNGWAEIFKLFLTHSDEQDLGKIKLDAMKVFAERIAKSSNIKIESEYIEYEAKYKAVVKSARMAA
jgi:hypothetical protein